MTGRRRFFSARDYAVYGYPVATVVLIFVVWELAARAGYFPRYLLPSPTGVAVRFAQLKGLIFKELMVTLEETLLGFGLSVVVGIPLAMALTSSRTFNRAIYPLLIGSQVVPKVALAPLFLVWFGFGLMSKVLIVFLVAFFPIVIDAIVGLESTDTGKLYVGSATGGEGIWSRWCAYSTTGHGGNCELADLLREKGDTYAENFHFGVLEIADTHASTDDILRRESYWKDLLRTRVPHGYNAK